MTLICREKVLYMLGVDRMTLNHLEKSHGFPKKIAHHYIRNGKNSISYKFEEYEVKEWIEQNRTHALLRHMQVPCDMVKDFFKLMCVDWSLLDEFKEAEE